MPRSTSTFWRATPWNPQKPLKSLGQAYGTFLAEIRSVTHRRLTTQPTRRRRWQIAAMALGLCASDVAVGAGLQQAHRLVLQPGRHARARCKVGADSVSAVLELTSVAPGWFQSQGSSARTGDYRIELHEELGRRHA